MKKQNIKDISIEKTGQNSLFSGFINSINTKRVISFGVILLLAYLITLIELFIIDNSMKIYLDNWFSTLGLFALIVLLLSSIYFYIIVVEKRIRHISRTLGVIFTAIVMSIIASFIVKEYIDYYAMPIALCSIIVVLILDKKIAVFATVITAQIIFVTYIVVAVFFDVPITYSDSIAVVTSMIGGLFIIYSLNLSYTRYSVLRNSFLISIGMGVFAFVAGAITDGETAKFMMSGVWTVVGTTLSAVFALAIMPIIEKAFGMVSNFSIMEMCSLDNSILKKLRLEAPGTFNHSIAVSIIAENCALAIGENPLIARAAAYYHDVGKLADPHFFIENSADGYNPHDELIPSVSVRKIIMHTEQGYKLLVENKYPLIIADVAREHHGDSLVQSFYNKAQNITESEVDKEEFCYRGPRPNSSYAAIIMIADMVEAATRALNIDGHKELVELVDRLVKDKILSNQFDDCDLTMQEINSIKEAIISSIPRIRHKRLEYKEIKND